MVNVQISKTVLCLNYGNAKCISEIKNTVPDLLYLLPLTFSDVGPRQSLLVRDLKS